MRKILAQFLWIFPILIHESAVQPRAALVTEHLRGDKNKKRLLREPFAQRWRLFGGVFEHHIDVTPDLVSHHVERYFI